MDLDPEIQRRNVVLGLALFGVFLVLLAGAVVAALIYIVVDS